MDLLLHILNISVVVIFAVAYSPQIYTTIKGNDYSGVSEEFWYYIAISTVISLHNLLMTGHAEWYIYMGQIINATIAFTFFMWFNFVFNKNDKLMLLAYILGYFVGVPVITNFVPIHWSQSFASITIILAYIHQISHFIRAKKSDGTNPLLYLLFTLGLGILTVIMFITNVSTHVIATELINIALLFTCFILSIKYKNKKIN